MRKRNRLALIAVASFAALTAGMGLALLAGGQAFASDAVERIIQPPGLRAVNKFTETQILPLVTSDGEPATHTLVLPSVRDQDDAARQSAAGKPVTRTLILPLVKQSASDGERARHKLVLPLVTQPDKNSQATAAGKQLTDRLLLPFVMASGATRQAATQLKAVATCVQSIQNGDFEAAVPGKPWASVANLSYSRSAESFISAARAHAGKQSARIGSPTRANYWSEFIQTIELPKRTTSVTLTYWRYLELPKASGTRAADNFTAGIETEQGIQIVAPQKIDVSSAGRGTWVRSTLTLPNAGAYSGKRLWITFKGRTGARYPATLYIDDVQLSVCALR